MRSLFVFLMLALAVPAAAEAPKSWAALRLETAMADYAEGDYRRASKGFKRLADHGSAIAETMLGLMHAEGKGVRPQATVAAGYFYRAASRGYGPAQIALSDAFATGRGVRPSAAEAYFWALAAARGGDRSAEAEGLARLARLGQSLSRAEIVAMDARLHDWRPRAVRSR